ncbi:integrase core domain-containing protein [Nonomuraea sp. NPDC049625]|uniref:integrase core domain-containing protein n=1 Tax=Nonomuraea sp. NPDC049625 TaxID=3155775 RepID=UPI003415F3A9
MRWHRDLVKRRHARACAPKRRGRPPTVRSIRTLVLRLVRKSPSWGYRRVHLACDFIETVTLGGRRQYILAVIEHATRRIRVPGTTAHPTANWVAQAVKNLVMDLEDAGCRLRYLIRDRDGKFPELMDEILAEAGIQTVLTGIRMPRMNAIMERWVQSCRHELLDRCLLWNERHLQHALREYEQFYNRHRAHQALAQAAPLRPVPDPITDPERITSLTVRRRDRLGGVLPRVLTCRLNRMDGIFGRGRVLCGGSSFASPLTAYVVVRGDGGQWSPRADRLAVLRTGVIRGVGHRA